MRSSHEVANATTKDPSEQRPYEGVAEQCGSVPQERINHVVDSRHVVLSLAGLYDEFRFQGIVRKEQPGIICCCRVRLSVRLPRVVSFGRDFDLTRKENPPASERTLLKITKRVAAPGRREQHNGAE